MRLMVGGPKDGKFTSFSGFVLEIPVTTLVEPNKANSDVVMESHKYHKRKLCCGKWIGYVMLSESIPYDDLLKVMINNYNPKATATNEIHVELGQDFQCPCGEILNLGGAWLAAHWQEHLKRVCHKCEQLFLICAGDVRLSSDVGPWNQDGKPDDDDDED